MSADGIASGGIREVLDLNPINGERRIGPRRFWTGREEKVLREQYAIGGVPGCVALLPGRSASSIYNRANLLELRSPATIKRRGVPRERWSASEQTDAVIRNVYQRIQDKNDITNLAKTIGRPRWWVSKRAAKLGLISPRFKAPTWSATEIAIIGENGHLSAAAIRRRLLRAGFKRTETAILVKLKREGVGTGRDADPDHYTAGALSQLFGIDAKGVTAWIIKGWLKAKRRGTARTDQQGGDEWWVHRKDVRRFVIDNAAAVDVRKVEKSWFIDLLARSA